MKLGRVRTSVFGDVPYTVNWGGVPGKAIGRTIPVPDGTSVRRMFGQVWAVTSAQLTRRLKDTLPGEGFEPPAFGLQNRCTTTVLTRRRRPVESLARLSCQRSIGDGRRGRPEAGAAGGHRDRKECGAGARRVAGHAP